MPVNSVGNSNKQMRSKEVMGRAGLYLEEAFKDIGQGKVGPQLLISDVVLVLTQSFSPEAGVPLPQLLLEPLAKINNKTLFILSRKK